MNIVVLAGGTSTERDISIMTSVKVCESLRRNGHNANIIDVFFGIEDKAAETFFNDNGNDLEKIAADMKKKDILVDDELADRKKSGKGFFGDNVLALCLKADIVFMGLHGSNGEDGKPAFLRRKLGAVSPPDLTPVLIGLRWRRLSLSSRKRGGERRTHRPRHRPKGYP